MALPRSQPVGPTRESPSAPASDVDVAISSEDFVLLNSGLHSVVNLLGLSRAVFRRIKFNFG